MTYTVSEFNPYGVTTLARLSSFAAAEAWIMARNPVHYERDADFPGCADAFMASGAVLAIGLELAKAEG